ncbi:MAG: ABC transporter ATP-binding protein [Desulfatirhabdiaceae bacterium]
MSIIDIRHLSHEFSNGQIGLTDISLSIDSGEFVVLAGLNGSGKTTLIKHLNGLLASSSGMVSIDGLPVEKDVLRARKMVGMVFQDADSQIVGETVYADVAFGPENLGLGRDEIDRRVISALDKVGLQHLMDHRPHQLSGGEKRRLAIAGVLAMKPCILVFDEPFSNLDYTGTVQILSHIIDLHQAGNTILVSSHDLDWFMEPATRLILMQDGRIISDGKPEELLCQAGELGIIRPLAPSAERFSSPHSFNSTNTD